ncbi:unnamed protein product [Ectocarpus sp. 12 AP-2014]
MSVVHGQSRVVSVVFKRAGWTPIETTTSDRCETREPTAAMYNTEILPPNRPIGLIPPDRLAYSGTLVRRFACRLPHFIPVWVRLPADRRKGNGAPVGEWLSPDSVHSLP